MTKKLDFASKFIFQGIDTHSPVRFKRYEKLYKDEEVDMTIEDKFGSAKFGSAPVDNSPYINDLIEKITRQIRDKELEILDEFSKAFLASETACGKDLIGVIKDYELQMTTKYNDDGSYTVKYKYVRGSDEV